MVVGPGLVSTLPAFMRSIARHPAGPHGRLAQKRLSGPHCWEQEGSTQFAQGLPDRCDTSTACRLCRLEPWLPSHMEISGNECDDSAATTALQKDVSDCLISYTDAYQ